MAQLNGNKIFNALIAFFSPTKATFTDTADVDLVANTYGRLRARLPISDGGTAGTAVTTTVVFTNDTGGNLDVSGATVATPVAITASDSVYATFTLSKVDAAGINPVVVATYVSNVAGTGTTALLPKALALSTVAGARTLATGWSLVIAVAKASTGSAIAAATADALLQVKLEPTS